MPCGHRSGVGVLEIGGGLDLLDESRGPQHGGKFGPQHLDGDLPLVLEVFGQVDRCHAARTEFVLDGIAVGEGAFEAIKSVRHGAAP